MEWELNQSDMETLRPKLVPRLVTAVRKYFLWNIDPNNQVPSVDRKAWCKDNMSNVQSLGEQISHYCMSEPTFIAGGTSITDQSLQSRTESVLTTYFMPA